MALQLADFIGLSHSKILLEPNRQLPLKILRINLHKNKKKYRT
jgi:hypothetical protein